MRRFGRSFELWFVSVTFAASVAPCGASVVLDAPGHAALEGVAVTARGGEPGVQGPWILLQERHKQFGLPAFPRKPGMSQAA